MRVRKRNIAIARFATVLLAAHCAALYADSLGYEFVGQVLNASATQSLQYGYLSSVPGLDTISTTSAPVSETNALLSFYNDTTTQQVINNGPIRVIDRTGTATIFFNSSGGGDFANPDTFRAGKPIQTCTLRHQVVIDTSSGYFTASFEMTITSVRVFSINGSRYVLGRAGEVYHWSVYGKLTQQGPLPRRSRVLRRAAGPRPSRWTDRESARRILAVAAVAAFAGILAAQPVSGRHGRLQP
jgi:hypothetical protein